jgi:hypothetical protein
MYGVRTDAYIKKTRMLLRLRKGKKEESERNVGKGEKRGREGLTEEGGGVRYK